MSKEDKNRRGEDPAPFAEFVESNKEVIGGAIIVIAAISLIYNIVIGLV